MLLWLNQNMSCHKDRVCDMGSRRAVIHFTVLERQGPIHVVFCTSWAWHGAQLRTNQASTSGNGTHNAPPYVPPTVTSSRWGQLSCNA